MAVTQRTRFEVLRRDGHSCRYCGATAPDVKLTVDHVTPKALGGGDDPSNLVAACQQCNSGKASTSLDSEAVADIREDALRQAELLKQAYAVLVERMGQRDDYVDNVAEHLEYHRYRHVPDDWRGTIGRWFEMGVPEEIVTDAIERAAKRETVSPYGRFKYMCGIVWNQVSAISEQIALREAFDGAWMTEEDRTEERIAAYETGSKSGERTMWRHTLRRYSSALLAEHALREVVDGRTGWSEEFDHFRDRAIEGIVWKKAA